MLYISGQSLTQHLSNLHNLHLRSTHRSWPLSCSSLFQANGTNLARAYTFVQTTSPRISVNDISRAFPMLFVLRLRIPLYATLVWSIANRSPGTWTMWTRCYSHLYCSACAVHGWILRRRIWRPMVGYYSAVQPWNQAKYLDRSDYCRIVGHSTINHTLGAVYVSSHIPFQEDG